MAGTAVVLQLISLFFCCVSGAHLQYGNTRLNGSRSNVTLTVGRSERVYCVQPSPRPVPTAIEWYNPQGRLVSRNNRDEMNGGRTAGLNFQNYQQSQGGTYECRVIGPGNHSETLSVCIGPANKSCADEVIGMASPTSMTTSTVITGSTDSPTQPPSEPLNLPAPTALPPSKVVGVRVTPSAKNASPTLTVAWQAVAGEAVNYTVKYSTQPGKNNTPPEGTLEVKGISGTATILTALERGSTYYIWLVGVSEGGEGPHSDRMTGVTYDTPDQVSGVRFVPYPYKNFLSVEWSRPQGDVPILYYETWFRRHTGNHSWQGPINTTTESITLQSNLLPSGSYGVQVRAVSAIGAGPYSSEETVKLPGSPTVNITTGPSWLYVEWNAQSATFRVLYRESGAPDYQVIAPPTSQLSHNISALQPNTLYNVVVEATHTVTQQKFNSSVTSAYTRPHVFEAHLQLGSSRLFGSSPNVTMTVGRSVAVRCLQLTGPVPTAIEWYNPQGQLVSRDGGDKVNQAGAGGSRSATLNIQSYQQSQGGRYECRVTGPGDNLEKLSVCIVPTNKSCSDKVTGMPQPTSMAASTVITESTTSPTQPQPEPSTMPAPTAEPPSKVVGVRVTPGVQKTSPTLTVTWQAVAGGAVNYTVKYSTQPGEVNTPPEGALEVKGISGTSTILTALEGGTTYYIWVVGVSKGGEGPHSDRMSGVTYDMNVTLDAVPSTKGMPSIGAVVGAVVAVVGVLLLIGIAVVVVIAIVLRRKTKAVSFKPDVRAEEEEVQKASRHIPNMRREENKVGDSESIEMTPLPATNDSRALAESASQPSRVVPKSHFSEHVKAMHKERDSGFKQEYLTIENVPDGAMGIAKAHRPKNRYLNIHTYDASRVVLSVPDVNGSDYINASYIDGYNQRSAYIASQGPNADTVSDFIQMVWDQRPPVLVMLTRLMEKGKSKCERYWCDEMNKPLEIVDRGFTVTVTGKEVYADYEVRDMTIRCTGDPSTKPLKLKHFFFTTWPDHGVPQHPFSMIKFIQHIRKVFLDSSGPLLVHCSAGVGRTGSFIATDAMMQRLKERDDLDIYNFVTQMRTKRTYMVQNLDQYAFIHDVLNDYLHCGDTSVAAHKLGMVIADMQKEDPQTSCSGFEQQFKLLQELSQVPCMADIKYAKKASIMKRNRYKDRFPYSTGHIHLSGKASHQVSKASGDYYNATFLDGYSVPKAFIAAQSPMSNTKGDFWEMVWQFRTPTIVLLTNFKEGKQEACANVWPAAGHETIDHYDVKCNEVQPCDGYDVIKLEVTSFIGSNSANLEVTVFHYKKWPRDGNPELLPLLEMMGKIDRARQKDKAALVMCDDGMSRTGVFIATMCEVERVKVEGEVDIFQTIKAMRKKRPHMVYSKEQYTLCFELLQMYVDSFDTYANFKALS